MALIAELIFFAVMGVGVAAIVGLAIDAWNLRG